MYSRLIFGLILLLSVAVVSASAQDPTPSPTPFDADKQGVKPEQIDGVPAIAPTFSSDERVLPDLGRVGVDMAAQRPMTVREAVALALENNKDIDVTRKNVQIAEFELRALRGFFQPRLVGQTYYERSTVPNVSIFSTNRDTTDGAFVGTGTIRAYVPSFGTVLSATANNQRVTTNNPISILSPQSNANLGFSITQPLLRGRRIDEPRRGIEIAKRTLSLTDAEFRERSIEIVKNVQLAYWDLTYALRNLQVQRDGVRDAKQQLEHNRRLVEEGQLAPIDIVAAETQVALFEQSVFDALNTVTQAENGLKNLISPNRFDVLWKEALVPVDAVDLKAPSISLNDAITAAMENRPELERLGVLKSINDVQEKLFRDQSLPQVDLVASYTSSGIGGNLNPDFQAPFPLPCTTDPNSPACQQQQANLQALTGNPYSGVFGNRYPTYRVGVTINIPLFGDKTAKALLGRARVEGERITTQREQIEQMIQVEVRNSIQAVRTAEARLRSAAISRENSARQYESEQRKLDAGQSDIYAVLERQTALTTARSTELRAQTELNKAIADLDRATGNALKANDIETRLRSPLK